MERPAPRITSETLAASLDHVFVMFQGAAHDTATVDRAISGSGWTRISRVAFERCATNPDATVAMFVGWDGEQEALIPVLSQSEYAMASQLPTQPDVPTWTERMNRVHWS